MRITNIIGNSKSSNCKTWKPCRLISYSIVTIYIFVNSCNCLCSNFFIYFIVGPIFLVLIDSTQRNPCFDIGSTHFVLVLYAEPIFVCPIHLFRLIYTYITSIVANFFTCNICIIRIYTCICTYQILRTEISLCIRIFTLNVFVYVTSTNSIFPFQNLTHSSIVNNNVLL